MSGHYNFTSIFAFYLFYKREENTPTQEQDHSPGLECVYNLLNLRGSSLNLLF